MKLSCQYDWTWLLLPMADTFNMWSLNPNEMNQNKQWMHLLCWWDRNDSCPTNTSWETDRNNSRDRLYNAILDLLSEKKWVSLRINFVFASKCFVFAPEGVFECCLYWQPLLFSLLIVLLMYRPAAHIRAIPRTRNSSTTWSGLITNILH